MSRFYKVMGKPGVLAADPFRRGGPTPHFLGQQEKSPPPAVPAGEQLDLHEFYEPCEQIVECKDPVSRMHVLTLKRNDEIVVLAECEARSREEAEKKMAQRVPLKSAKGGE